MTTKLDSPPPGSVRPRRGLYSHDDHSSRLVTARCRKEIYTAELKQCLTGRPDARFIWLCNFEVENEWAHNYVGLPVPRLSTTTSTIQRMEELGALIAEPIDYLLLGKRLDEEYRRYVERLGLGLPTELVVQAGVPDARTSQSVLGSPKLLRQLSELAEQGTFLMPMGASAEEQKIANATGLQMAVPDADTFQRVNSKIYSRRLVEELGLRAIPGYACETVAELRDALGDGPSKDQPVIVKDAFGVSGKGLVVLDNPTKAQRLLRMVDQRARRTGIEALHVVVERFLAKRFDLNYQLTIDRDGGVRFAFVKEALTVGGVHKGHIMPPALTATQYQEIAEGAERIGARLYADGFFGVVGVDALLGADDLVYPVLEINARLNMSSYQGRVTERFLWPGHVALAKHYPLRLSRPVSFDEVHKALGALAVAPEGGTGLVITCFGTVNAQAATSTSFDGRLYAILFAADRTALADLDARVTDSLSVLETMRGKS
jgi:hypothetical protein